MRRSLAAALAALIVAALAPQSHAMRIGTFAIATARGPFISASRIPLSVTGAPGRTLFSLAGPGSITGTVLDAPEVSERTSTRIIAAAQGAIAVADVALAPPPKPSQPLIAVAAYDDGIALHDPSTFALIGYAGIGGPPGDVAFARDGSILAPDTDGDTLAWFARKPWRARWIGGVPEGNEIALDLRSGSAFVSDRDFNGAGALTRILPAGQIAHVVTGQTAQGLAVDPARGVVYTGNVNDESVAEVDARTMTVRRKLRSVPRTFGIALDAKAQRLYVVANVSPDMHSGAGRVEELDLRSGARVVARSTAMIFPLGIVLDTERHRAFVTDESADVVYVLDSRSLKSVRAPLQTCRTPWRPRIFHGRLYVPCARANAVDVIDLRTLRRVRGAPFKTGGFPLSVAVWP